MRKELGDFLVDNHYIHECKALLSGLSNFGEMFLILRPIPIDVVSLSPLNADLTIDIVSLMIRLDIRCHKPALDSVKKIEEFIGCRFVVGDLIDVDRN